MEGGREGWREGRDREGGLRRVREEGRRGGRGENKGISFDMVVCD